MLIAGISGYERNAAVALYRDGDLIAVCEEGRVKRVRDLGIRSGGFPRAALDVTLSTLGARAESVQEFVYAEPGVASVAEGVSRSLDHHYAHAATAFFTSPYDEALVVVCDSNMSRELTVWSGTGASLEQTDIGWRGPAFASLYSRLTSLLGLEAGTDEYLVEALARRALPADLTRVRDMVRYEGHSLSTADGFADYVKQAAVGPDDQARAMVAGAVQQWLGELLLRFLTDVAPLGPQKVCLGGGLFFNTYFNTLVRESGVFDNVFVPINPGNAGVAAGCALARGLERDGLDRHPTRVSPFLGPKYSNQQIKAVLDNCKVSYEFCEDGQCIRSAVEALRNGGLVGWFRGRLEWGTRALGNRSIFANPFAPFVLENLNSFLKQREPYRAYGLAVPDAELGNWFEGPSISPYMECEYRLRDPQRFAQAFPTGTSSLRVQTVGREPAPLPDLLTAFGAATGVPVLINTSFNGLHEPIVCTPRDAVRVFYGTGLDLLVLGNFVLRK